MCDARNVKGRRLNRKVDPYSEEVISVSRPIIRILVMDDEPATRSSPSSLLLERGFLVAKTSSGEDALKLLSAESFDAVLLEVKIPDIGGIETLRRICSYGHELPILILAARDKEEEKVEAFNLGADDYIIRPFSTLELIARVRLRVERVRRGFNVETAPMQISHIRLGPANLPPIGGRGFFRDCREAKVEDLRQ